MTKLVPSASYVENNQVNDDQLDVDNQKVCQLRIFKMITNNIFVIKILLFM